MDMHTRIWEKRDQLVGVDKALSGILFMRRAVFDHTVLPFLINTKKEAVALLNAYFHPFPLRRVSSVPKLAIEYQIPLP